MVNATKICRVDVAWPLEGWAFFKQGDKEIAPCREGGLKATLFCRLDKATKQCQSDVLLSICHCWNYLDYSILLIRKLLSILKVPEKINSCDKKSTRLRSQNVQLGKIYG